MFLYLQNKQNFQTLNRNTLDQSGGNGQDVLDIINHYMDIEQECFSTIYGEKCDEKFIQTINITSYNAMIHKILNSPYDESSVYVKSHELLKLPKPYNDTNQFMNVFYLFSLYVPKSMLVHNRTTAKNTIIRCSILLRYIGSLYDDSSWHLIIDSAKNILFYFYGGYIPMLDQPTDTDLDIKIKCYKK